MNRQEVYNKCVEKIYLTLKDYEEGICLVKYLLPKEAIDAIIDCAVEEAVKAMEEEKMRWATHKVKSQCV